MSLNRSLSDTAGPSVTPSSLDYRAVLGQQAWQALPIATRRRFSTHSALYEGTMTMRSSWLGWLFAWLATVVGSPLPKLRRARVATTVTVAPDAATGGSRWTRRYTLEGRESTIESVKALDDKGRVVERLAAGLRMRLELFVHGGALHFKSTAYFLECAGIRIQLPSWSLPGCTEVIHRDLGAGRFRFTMRIRHAVLGELFHHEGVFAPRGDVS